MRQWIVTGWLLLIMTIIGSIFWYNEWIYELPTPIPKNYRKVSMGEHIGLDERFNINRRRPLFMHFFNPDCPCSRFNIPAFRAIWEQYNKEVDFVVVVLSKNTFSANEIREKLRLQVPVYFGPDIAKSCGVYSTPQAVILDTEQRLYYRGNYNRSRYCTDEKTSFAKIALEGILRKNQLTRFNPIAFTAYGCQLPGCEN